ncbi:MAG: choice-of-anchor L domain-containing protein, partial [Flavobacteriaceae bacterium]
MNRLVTFCCLFLLSFNFLFAQDASNYLTVDQSTYTVDQLVEDILINSSCAEISNIISSTGSDFGSVNGIGYFSGNDSSFPFSEGLILSTGDAELADGPETFIQGYYDTIGWDGDSDLTNEIPDHDNSNDATFIQFDFIPQASEISFNFIFASEEYGTFQCGYTDAFAFLLTNNQTGQTTNLALVPGTSDPISVTTVRDGQYNSSCGSVNDGYFASYYGWGGDNPQDSPTNFIGHTVSMQAQSDVIPNSSYTIKLAIADYIDSNYDSAVFLEAGSFDLGGNLGEDITIQSGNALCDGGAITLDSQLPDANHIWYFNGVEITGESSSIIDISQEGTYSVDIIYGIDCSTSDSILIEYKPAPQIYNSVDLFNCESAATSFNLSENTPLILGPQNPNEFNISYHLSIQDAENDLTPIITNLTNFTTSDPNTIIYIRIEDAITESCFVTESFNLISSGPAAPTGDTEQIFCYTATLANLTATGDNVQWYDAASDGNLLDLTAVLTNGEVVYASQTVDGCESTERLAVTASFQDTEVPLADLASLPSLTAQCELTALTPPTATDTCDGTITGLTTTTLPIMTSTTITWTYTDSRGNEITQTQDVLIQDTEAPVADLASLPQLTAQCELTALTPPTATDSCDGIITGLTTTTLPIMTSTTITWTYTDSVGNSSTQTQDVLIQDTEAPLADLAS